MLRDKEHLVAGLLHEMTTASPCSVEPEVSVHEDRGSWYFDRHLAESAMRVGQSVVHEKFP